MSDLISRQAAIDAIQNEVEPFVIVEPGTACVIGAGVKDADVIRTIEQLPSAEPEPHWIPCSERLPEKSTRCLVTWKSMFHTIEIDVAKYGRMFLSERKGLGFYLHGSDVDADITDEVIAWMELPPAYKEETDE